MNFEAIANWRNGSDAIFDLEKKTKFEIARQLLKVISSQILFESHLS